MNVNRKLASIQEVKDVVPITGADRIEAVKVLGWTCVASKGDFHPGDKCVYFEIDSFLPVEDRYEVLRRNQSYKKNTPLGEGFRVHTQMFMGCVSQGFILPLSAFPELSEPVIVGTDLTETLNVKVLEADEDADIGNILGSLPPTVIETEEYRIQSYPELLNEMHGKAYYATLKIDGTSATVGLDDNKPIVCGHHCQVAYNENYKYFDLLQKLDIFNKLQKAGYSNISVQGEIAGPGIRKNRTGLKELHFFVFNVIQDGKHFTYDELIEFIKKTGLEMVPICEEGDSFNFTLEELIEKSSTAKYSTGRRAEGIVYRTKEDLKSPALRYRKMSFKVLNNKFLLKNDL